MQGATRRRVRAPRVQEHLQDLTDAEGLSTDGEYNPTEEGAETFEEPVELAEKAYNGRGRCFTLAACSFCLSPVYRGGTAVTSEDRLTELCLPRRHSCDKQGPADRHAQTGSGAPACWHICLSSKHLQLHLLCTCWLIHQPAAAKGLANAAPNWFEAAGPRARPGAASTAASPSTAAAADALPSLELPSLWSVPACKLPAPRACPHQWPLSCCPAADLCSMKAESSCCNSCASASALAAGSHSSCSAVLQPLTSWHTPACCTEHSPSLPGRSQQSKT